MKSLIANTVVKWFKSLSICGRFRFWCLYWAYRITGWHIRHREWDFVLDYLPQLHNAKDSKGFSTIFILDVGSNKSLFTYEIEARGYGINAIDIEENELSSNRVSIHDIRKPYHSGNFDFVTCISVLEHIEGETGQEDALRNMINTLKIGGRLLLTIPTHEFASQDHPWHGFNNNDVEKLLPSNATILEYTERMGQLCLCISKEWD